MQYKRINCDVSCNNSLFLKRSHRAESQQTENPTQSDHAELSF